MDLNRAILVQIDTPQKDNEEFLAEFKELATAARIEPVAELRGAYRDPDPTYYIGKGKTEELKTLIQENKAGIVLFNHPLSPAQERNLEKLLNCRVLDRTELILDIFAQRARTHEGKLQVELAQLEHQATRLVRGWTHLERQKGGIGLRGPGETQLESDRRLIRDKIKLIKQRLQKVRDQRNLARQKRIKKEVPLVSLVGYTHAGKSTLFNCLTQADVHIAHKLFSTLDPTIRKITLPHFGEIILADTVGFIRELPHQLVEAFRATLEETLHADLLLHVTDYHSKDFKEHVESVDQVLKEIGADQIPTIMVMNKIDLISHTTPAIEKDENGRNARVWISAKDGSGMNPLLQEIASALSKEVIHGCIRLTHQESPLRARLYEWKAVLNESFADNGDALLEIRLPADKFATLWEDTYE